MDMDGIVARSIVGWAKRSVPTSAYPVGTARKRAFAHPTGDSDRSKTGLATAEEIEQRRCGRLRIFLWQIVPAVDREAAHIVRPFAPRVERAARLAWNAARAPERQHRAGNLSSRRAVGLVMSEIGGAAGPVVLAGRMDAQRIG